MKHRTPQAVQACHDCLLWIVPQLDKFPRKRKYTLGNRIELDLLDVLSQLLTAQYQRNNAPALAQANGALAVIRHLWRLAFELKLMAVKQYRYGSELLLNLGTQIGGWYKHSARSR